MSQAYTPTTSDTPEFGQMGPSVAKLQEELNARYANTPGYVPLKVDAKYGPLTQAAANMGDQQKQPPEVAPTPSVPSLTKPIPESGYIPRATAQTPPADEVAKNDPDSKFRDLLNNGKGLIDAINKEYDYKAKQARAASAGLSAASGLGGSSAAESSITAAMEPILNERNVALQTAYQTISTQNRANSTEAIKALAANHLDWNEYKKTNPKNYQQLVDSLGGDPNVADAMFATNVPKQDVQQTWITGTKYNQLVTDPVTGKPSVQTYDLGVKLPENWVSEKIGTNATIYHGPNWDPHDPSTYQIFGIDPLTGLPTGQIGGNDNPTAPVAPDTITGAVSTVANVAGIEDPTMPLSDAVSKYGVDNIVSGIIKNEGGSPSGVMNNPGNIKYAGLPGQTDSGVKATDGGTFASYASDADGRSAIAQLITNGANNPSTSFAGFINKYTGQTMGNQSGSATETPPAHMGGILNATGISLPVFNYLTQGTSSMSRMSAPQRNQIMKQASDFLNKNGIDVATFQSQYKAYNDSLAQNVKIFNNTRRAETELIGTIDNLSKAANDVDLKKLKAKNVIKILSGEQVNDPDAIRYATHLKQIISEFAQYNAALEGKTGAELSDVEHAEDVIKNGISANGLTGFAEAIKASTEKMDKVLSSNVDATRKQVWDLFGVGDKYKPPAVSAKDTVETALKDQGLKYEEVLASTPSGQIPVVDKSSGNIGYISPEEFDGNKYTKL